MPFVAKSVVLILQTPPTTVQQAGSRSSRLSMSTLVHDPSGQSSVVMRYDSEMQRCSPSQFALNPLAVAASLMSWLPLPMLPMSCAVRFPDPFDDSAQPPALAGTAGAQAEVWLDAWVAV